MMPLLSMDSGHGISSILLAVVLAARRGKSSGGGLSIVVKLEPDGKDGYVVPLVVKSFGGPSSTLTFGAKNKLNMSFDQHTLSQF